MAISDAEGHTMRDWKGLAGALVSPTSSPPAAFLKALATPKESRKEEKEERKIKKETIGAEAGEQGDMAESEAMTQGNH